MEHQNEVVDAQRNDEVLVALVDRNGEFLLLEQAVLCDHLCRLSHRKGGAMIFKEETKALCLTNRT